MDEEELEKLRVAARESFRETREAWAAWLRAQEVHRQNLVLLADYLAKDGKE